MPLEYFRVVLMVNLTAKLLPASLGCLPIFKSVYSMSHFTTNGRRVTCAASLEGAKPEEFGIVPVVVQYHPGDKAHACAPNIARLTQKD